MPSLVERLWYEDSVGARFARAGLGPVAWAFGAATTVRGLLYDSGLLSARRATLPVVSIGNLSVGGTGKTPVVIWLVECLAERGLRTAVASRGYGSERMSTIISTWSEPVRRTLEASGSRVRHVRVDAEGNVEHGGPPAADEALLVALRTGTPVVTAVDRFEACRLAEIAFAPDLIVLDDGFQHRRLVRDIDIVIVGEDDRVARLLPIGPLREPPRALLRADIVVSAGGSGGGPHLTRRPLGLVREAARHAAIEPMASIEGRRIVAVAGIARPDGFAKMLEDAGARVVATHWFRDHHRYGEDDWRTIVAAAERAEVIVTTEKDLVKLACLAGGDPRLVAVRLEVDIDGADALLDLVVARLRLDAKDGGPHHREPHGRR